MGTHDVIVRESSSDFSNNELMRFSDELNVTNQRYSYYPVNVQGQMLNGDERNSMRLELRFASKDVFLVIDDYVCFK
ncbi:conserved protein of unknown function [Shewanella benthica]|uniref:Uncharacterized protein n=1 Tax=Shewanella benthica TaxID=43661 RepID=A0A330LXF2_9GAMM|nr:conserved protein of unknown function [Shewanella benthica]